MQQSSPGRRAAGRSSVGIEEVGVSFFYVRAYKYMDADMTVGARQTVMNDYLVKQNPSSAGTTETNTHDWEYVGVREGQTIKYWDYSATAYRFFGFTIPEDKTYTLTSNAEGTADVLTYDGTFALSEFSKPLFSRLAVVTAGAGDYNRIGKPVQLGFCYGVAMVEVRFYMGADPLGNVSLDNIVFEPVDTETKIPTAVEQVTITYPTAGNTEEDLVEKVSLDAGSSTISALTFDDLTLERATYGTPKVALPNIDACAASTVYCLLPQTNPAYTLSLRLNSIEKTATVPEAYMQWKANHKYTYIFKLTPDLDIVLETVFVDDWKIYEHKTTVDTW